GTSGTDVPGHLFSGAAGRGWVARAVRHAESRVRGSSGGVWVGTRQSSLPDLHHPPTLSRAFRFAPCRATYNRGCATALRARGSLSYHFAMGKRSSNVQFEVTCPDCGAVLKIDGETRAMIGHKSAERPKTFQDLDEAARAMHEQEGRRDSIFRQ